MATLGFGPLEGQSSNRPPYFNGSNFNYWKARMKIYIQSIDYELWKIVVNGPFTMVKNVEGKLTIKPEEEWDAQDFKKAQLNAKAIGLFYNALCESEFNRISACETAKEIWDKLEVAHEGTSQVKQTKIDQLMHKYELFKMNDGENISDMFTRFTYITNALKCLGKDFSDAELVRKVLRCLPKSWLPKVTAIQEAKDLTKMTLDELHGSLATHELVLEESPEEPTKKKSIALKSICKDDSDDESDEEIVLLMKKFNKFLKKRKFGRKSSRKDQSKSESSKDNIICFGCNKPGHYVSECPKNQKTSPQPSKKFNKKSKQKAMKAETWSDSEASDSDNDDNEDNRCLMAREDSDDDEVCLKLDSSTNMWYLDSGCSRHMTGDENKFTDLKPKGGSVTFGDNNKASIIGIGKIGKEDSPTIDNVLLVKGLKYNLLSISHLCDKNNRVIF